VWVPPLDFLTGKTNLYWEDLTYKYFLSMYYAVLMLGGNEMGPRTNFELGFVGYIMLAGAIINANIFGEMAVLVQMIKRKDQWF